MATLIYALTLVISGLLLMTFRRRIADFRNGIGGSERWGEARPRRYLGFGILLVILGLASLVGFSPF